MGCLPCKFLRRNNIKNVKQAGGEDSHHPNAHELTTVTSIVPDPLEEIESDITRVEEEIIGSNSKLPGTIDDGHKDETAPLLVASTSQSNIPSSSLSLANEQTEEDLQNAAILQSVVRAYIMRKNKLKEENTPFSELMVTTPSFPTFGLDDEPSLLIPQVPTFRAQLQQPPSNPINQSYGIPPPPQPQHSLFSSSQNIYPPHPTSYPSQSTVYPPSQPFQVPILQEISQLPQAPIRTPTKPLLANTLRHALSTTDT